MEGEPDRIPLAHPPHPESLSALAGLPEDPLGQQLRGSQRLRGFKPLRPGQWAVASLLAGCLLAAVGLTAWQAGQPQIFQDRLKDGSLGPKMVVIPAGEFLMGSLEDEGGRYDNEGPQHRVRIPKAFALGVTEVTFAEYGRFVLATTGATGRELPDDRGWGRGQRPVIYVSWEDATEYAQWLSA